MSRKRSPYEVGMDNRLDRIFNRKTKNTLIVPMDHGISEGPIKGLDNMPQMVDYVAEGGADAVVLHLGTAIAGYRGFGKDIGLILHDSASTKIGPDSNNKVQITTVEEGIILHIDCYSIHVNLGGDDNEPYMLQHLGSAVRECNRWGMPLLAMMYARGKNVPAEPKKPKKDATPSDLETYVAAQKKYLTEIAPHIAHVVRVAAEKGASIIKTPYTGDVDSMKIVIKGSLDVPVVIAGGPKTDTDRELLETLKGAMDAGCRGASIGRNIFQHDNPTAITRACAKIIHERVTVEEALRELKIV